MNINLLADLIKKAVYDMPPQELVIMAGQHYHPYYYLMYLLSPFVAGGTILELGVSNGWGVNSFAYGNPAAKVIGLDLNIEPETTLPNVDFHLMSALPPPSFIQPNIAILHVDTEHSYGNAKEEFKQYKPFLLQGAIVMFDDLHAMDDGVLRFFNELPYPKIQEDLLHPVCGYGVMIYE